jgi:FKBP-type peptidyl-prolyl cis-trans isomerase 2
MKKAIIIFFSISFLWLLGCSKTPKISIWDIVTISYTWILEDKEIFESGTKTITIWSWEVINWIEKSLIKKKLNQRFSIKIKPENWYGNQYSIHNQQRISAFVFEKLWLPTEIWSKITIDKTSGEIIDHEKDENWNLIIVFDINTPQTRQNTKYNIHVKNIEKKQAWDWYKL